VVIAELDVVGVAVQETETDPPLIVHANRVLPFAGAFECVESIAGWNFQIV
jgi:hypothetical protein